MAADIREVTSRLFDKAGIPIAEEKLLAFLRYYELLKEHNHDRDLTRLTRLEDIVIKHFIDSVYVTRLIELPNSLLDIGSGAGFPGIPLKIMFPGLKLVLAEGRKKRVSFMERVAAELGLDDVEFYPHMVTDKSHFYVDGVITRALESVDETLVRVHHFLPEKGLVIFMKGPDADRDLEACSDVNTERYRLVDDLAYTLPGTEYRRRLLVHEKTGRYEKRTYVIMKDRKDTAGKIIESPDNKTFKHMKAVTGIDGIKKEGKVLVTGKKIIADFHRKNPDSITELIISDGYVEDDSGLISLVDEFNGKRKLYILKKSLFRELDIYNTGPPAAVAELPAIPEWDRSVPAGCTLLLPFQDPVNLGSVARSAAGFGVKSIVLLEEAAHPYHPKSIRASAGAVFSADFSRGPSIHEIGELIPDGALLLALDKTGTDIRGYPFPEKFLLLPGLEGPGLPEELKINAVSIPVTGQIESLNAAVSVSIALYEASKIKQGVL